MAVEVEEGEDSLSKLSRGVGEKVVACSKCSDENQGAPVLTSHRQNILVSNRIRSNSADLRHFYRTIAQTAMSIRAVLSSSR
jgi:hypothetical protein